MADRPTLIVSGNCQARVLYQSLAASPTVQDAYRVVYVRNLRKTDQEQAAPEDLKDCALLLEQIAHKVPELPGKALMPAGARVIRYPILWLGSLWPLHVDDPRNLPAKGFDNGRWPYGDRLILDLLDQGFSPEEAASRWLDADVPALLDLDRLQEILETKARKLDQRADLALGHYVQARFRREPLFVTRNHFSEPMMRHLRDLAFAELGVEPPAGPLGEVMRGMGEIETPIHPSVARHFGLKWWRPEMRWRYGGEQLSTEEYLRRYAAFA